MTVIFLARTCSSSICKAGRSNEAPERPPSSLRGARLDAYFESQPHEVYVNPPAGEKLDIHTQGYVGNLSLFGLKPHAMAGHPPPLATDIYVEYDISHLVRDAMANNPKNLTVGLVPRGLFDARGEPLPCRRRRKAR
jgi:hypothetical protein